MINADYHVHTNFSSDGKASMEQMTEQAVTLGLQKICFTDHMDYDYPSLKGGRDFVFDMKEYIKKIAEIKKRYQGRIEIRTGIELGLQPHLKERLNNLLQSCSFDFVIGSSHLVDHMDPYYPTYWENCNAFDGFHVYGHLDYIIRYAPIQQKEKTVDSYTDYADVLDECLKTILSHGRGIEVNSSGFKYGLGHPHPSTNILKRYRELGGELITIGSDSHEPKHLCYDFARVADLLKGIGFRYYAVFVQGKPMYEKL
jgi:histidinol-phosphatase (PHP family)